MIFQLNEALFASEKSAFKVRELSTASRVGLAFLDLREKRHHRPSRPRNQSSKSLERCDDCGMVRVAYNSWRDRYGPKCQGLARAEWLGRHFDRD